MAEGDLLSIEDLAVHFPIGGGMFSKPQMLRADFSWPRPDRRREFLRARLNGQGGVELFPNQSSGVLTSAVWADGLVDNPAGATIEQGQMVRFLSFADLLSA